MMTQRCVRESGEAEVGKNVNIGILDACLHYNPFGNTLFCSRCHERSMPTLEPTEL